MLDKCPRGLIHEVITLRGAPTTLALCGTRTQAFYGSYQTITCIVCSSDDDGESVRCGHAGTSPRVCPFRTMTEDGRETVCHCCDKCARECGVNV